jgi:hypothetical protein
LLSFFSFLFSALEREIDDDDEQQQLKQTVTMKIVRRFSRSPSGFVPRAARLPARVVALNGGPDDRAKQR